MQSYPRTKDRPLMLSHKLRLYLHLIHSYLYK
nr:MAG TPA: hypothetical protein [Caudoviricetes sp.]